MSKKLHLSQNAHVRLNRKYLRYSAPTPKNVAYGNYHGYCIEEQSRLGRVLTRSERKKLFDYSWDDSVKKVKRSRLH